MFEVLRQFNGGWLQITIASIHLRHRRNNERTTFLAHKQSLYGGALSPSEAREKWNSLVRERKSRDRVEREDIQTGIMDDEIPLSECL